VHRSILYDAFNYYGARYRLGFTDKEAHAFWTQFTHVLFERAEVSGCPSGEVQVMPAQYVTSSAQVASSCIRMR
jgi:hypothetical protein